VERTSQPIPVTALEAAAKVRFDLALLGTECARARREADRLFDQMVIWAKHQRTAPRRGEQTIDALCDRRLQELIDKGRARGTLDKAESLMRLYVRPIIGNVEVADWTSDHCEKVLLKGRQTCGAERVQDLGTLLRSLVTLAHRKPSWLAKDDDPMQDVEYQIKSTNQTEGVRFVPVKERPSTEQVDALAIAMGDVGRATMSYLSGRPNHPVVVDRGYGWLLSQIMGKCGPRFGEVIALTVTSFARLRAEVEEAINSDLTLTTSDRTLRLASIIDLPHGYAIDPRRRLIWISETVEWDGSRPFIAPADIRASGKEPKSKKARWTIYPGSLLDVIVERCVELLERFGPDQGPAALFFPACDHDFVLVPDDPRKRQGPKRWQDQDWWSRSNFPRSMFKKAVAQAKGWPTTSPFPFENFRHHFATWAKRHGYSDELISHCMGHATVAYTQQRYFRTGADTIPQGMAASEHL
jgi:integrase